MKRCAKCGKLKEVSDFHKNNRTDYHNWCKDCRSMYNKERYRTNTKYRTDKLKRYKTLRSEWSKFFQSHYGNPVCGICGSALKWESDIKRDVVNWDHRNGSNGVVPSNFCGSRPCTPENVELWLSYDFGILCRHCNRVIPTNERGLWLENVTNYINGNS